MNREDAPTNGMIDLHCHLPFGVSDGPECIEDSRQMLKCAAESGITHITAVAHYGNYFPEVCRAVEELRADAEKLGITLHPAFEYDYLHLESINLEELRFIGPESRYILLDFNRERIPYAAPMRLFELAEQDVGIIIVHPEKLFGRSALPILKQFAEGSIALQINAMSLLPESPSHVRKMARTLLDKGLVHAVASDAHRPTGHRRCVMREAREIVSAAYGDALAVQLFEENPARMLKNLPPLDAPEFPNWWERLRRRWTGR